MYKWGRGIRVEEEEEEEEEKGKKKKPFANRAKIKPKA